MPADDDLRLRPRLRGRPVVRPAVGQQRSRGVMIMDATHSYFVMAFSLPIAVLTARPGRQPMLPDAISSRPICCIGA